MSGAFSSSEEIPSLKIISCLLAWLEQHSSAQGERGRTNIALDCVIPAQRAGLGDEVKDPPRSSYGFLWVSYTTVCSSIPP